MDNNIIVKFGGGLGNQLFDYVFYEWIKQEFPNRSIKADFSYFKIDHPHDCLEIRDAFPNTSIDEAGFKELFDITGEIPIFYGGPLKHKTNAIRKKINQKFFKIKKTVYHNDNDWVSPAAAYDAILEGKRYFDSYWQDAEFFIKTREKIINCLSFNFSDVVPFEDEMKKPNAVSMHIRRGDYVGSVFEKEVNEEYYSMAIQYMNSKVENPHFYIFSDDIEYAEKTYNWLENKTFISGFSGKKSHFDMYLMSITPNIIIANSTFSLWAAYLNKNVNPRIVYPAVEYMEHKKLNEWIGV